jgi:DNA-binding beta-propeller fold protein YncE
MKRLGVSVVTGIAVVLVLLLTGCQKTDAPAFKVVEGFSSPESVIAGPEGKRFYVANVGAKLEPSTKDGDGFISVLSFDGAVIERKFLPAKGVLNAPKGMAIVGGILYVADIDRVVGFDLGSGANVFELDFSGEKTVFLNDLAVIDAKTLVVSATDIGKVYEISLGGTPRFELFLDDMPGVNGLYYDGENRRLFAVSLGYGDGFNGGLSVISLAHGRGAVQDLTGPVGALDGVALMPDGRVIFSDWVAYDKTGVIRAYDLNTKTLSEIKLSEEVRGPADFYYDGPGKTLWLPRMIEGKVLVETLK